MYFARLIIVLSLLSLCTSFSAFAKPTIWQYATTSLAKARLGATGDIFSFTVPADGGDKQISIAITFFSTYSSSTSCTGSLVNQAYNNSCACAAYAGRTFYISQANLYKIINTFSPGNVSNVNCARIRDNKNFSNSIFKQTTCSSGSESCSNDSGTTAALPLDVATGNACSC